MAEVVLDRHAIADRGKRLEYFTIGWNTLEGIVSVIAGAFAGSISLVGFGLDSFIEVASGIALLCECRSMPMNPAGNKTKNSALELLACVSLP